MSAPPRPSLDQIIEKATPARLIPTAKQQELRLTTVLLATMKVVQPLAKSLLENWADRRCGKRARLETYTEVSFPASRGKSRFRPDGLLVLHTGRQRWTALVEAKAGTAAVEENQIANYVSVAESYGIDSVLSVSNQRVALPEHVPYRSPRSRKKHKIPLRHGSWASMRTEAELILNSKPKDEEDEVDEEQRYILEEMVHYFRHPKSGVLDFDRMNRGWQRVADAAVSGSPLSDGEIEAAVGAWHQEVRDLCLILSRRTHERVDTFLPLKHRGPQGAAIRLEDDCANLRESWRLDAKLRVPDAADDIVVAADFRRRTASCAMELQAPQDRVKAGARINWLKAQLLGRKFENGSVSPSKVHVRALWRGKGKHTQATLAEIRDQTWPLESESSRNLTRFVIFMREGLGNRFRNRDGREFVASLEGLVDRYYTRVGQHLRVWNKPPPQVAPSVEEEPEKGEASPSVEG